jgi:hypothetical protein
MQHLNKNKEGLMVVLEKKHHAQHSNNTLQHSQNIDITTNHINNIQTYIGNTQKTIIITPNNTQKALQCPSSIKNARITLTTLIKPQITIIPLKQN